MKHLWEVFRRLQQAGLTINLPKSEFFAKELKFLLHTVKGSSRLPSTQLRYGTTPLLRLKKILGLLNFFTLSFLPQRNWSSHQRDSWRRRRCFVGRKNNMAGIGLSRQPSLACVATVKTGFCQWSYLASEQDLDSVLSPHQFRRCPRLSALWDFGCHTQTGVNRHKNLVVGKPSVEVCNSQN